MNVWQQKLRGEITLYQSNVEKIKCFDRENFAKEYNALRQEMQKEIEASAKKHYSQMCESYALQIDFKTKKLTATQEINAISQKLKDNKKIYKKEVEQKENSKIAVNTYKRELQKLQEEAKQLNDSLVKGGFFNAIFGESKKARLNELGKAIDECNKKLALSINRPLSDEALANYEALFKQLEGDLKKARKIANETEKSERKNSSNVRFFFDSFCTDLDDIYNVYFQKLRENVKFKEYLQLIDRVDLRRKSPYITEHYGTLSPLMSLCSFDYFAGELSDEFSAPCRDLFMVINTYLEDKKNPIISGHLLKSYSALTFLADAAPLTDDAIYQIFEIENPGENKNEEEQVVFDSMYYDALALLRNADKVSASALQKDLKIGYARANRILVALEVDGFVGEYTSSGTRKVIKKKIDDFYKERENAGLNNSKLPGNIIPDLIKKLSSDSVVNAKAYLGLRSYVTECVCVNSEIIAEIITALDMVDGELPEIVMAIMKDILPLEPDYHSKLLEFKKMYYATPEQVAIANNEYYAQKKIDQIRENAALERKMYERQAQLDREAEMENAKLVAQAEYQRADAIKQQTEEMSRQAEMDRFAADRRAEQEISAMNAIADRERREREQARRMEEKRQRDAQSDAVRRAYDRCKQCKYRGTCHSKGTPNCASFVPG